MISVKRLLLLGLALMLLVLPAIRVVAAQEDAEVEVAEGEVADADDDIQIDGEDLEVETDSEGEVYDPYVDEITEEEQTEFTEAKGIAAFAVFPKQHDEGVFTLGDDILVLIGFSNNSPKGFNISSLGGYLLDNNGNYIQNYTRRALSSVVEPFSDVTVEYAFRADAGLEPGKFGFIADVTYNAFNGSHNFDRVYLSVAHNRTLDFVVGDREVESTRNFLLTVAAVIGGAVFFYFYTKPSGSSKGKKAAAEQGTKKVANSGFAEYEIVSPGQHKASKGSKKGSKKDSKKDSQKGN